MSRFLISRWLHTVILLALLTGIFTVRMQDYDWIKSLRHIAFDTYNKIEPREATDKVVIIDIDEESLGRKELGQWPWSRDVMARLVFNLEEMGAKAIVFDIVFAERDRTSPQSILDRIGETKVNDDFRDYIRKLPDNDNLFADAIKKAGNVVTGFIWADERTTIRRMPALTKKIFISKDARDLTLSIASMRDATTNIPELVDGVAGNGCFGVTPEIDGIIRRVPLIYRFVENSGKTTIYPSLALEAVRVFEDPRSNVKIRALKGSEEVTPIDPPYIMKVGQYEVPLDHDGHFFVYFSPTRRDKYISAWKAIDGSLDPDRVNGKIIFVGTSAQGLLDLRSTPLDLFIPGVEVHANVVEQILEGQYLLRPDMMQGLELIIVVVAGMTIILLAPFVGAVSMATFTLAMITSITLMSWYGFIKLHILFDPVYPSLCLLALFILSTILTYIRTEAERKRVRSAFGLYISPDFMDELTKDPDKLKLGGETRQLTVMFTDIRDFTSISESMSSEALIQLMNDFLTPMSDAVMESRGTIDKYMGDAMMAFWNAPLDDADHARHACQSALRMKAALDPINQELAGQAEAEGRDPLVLRAGIGINTGTASVGNMGSRQRFAYSALGDAVNLASRLEGQTKAYGVDILIGPDTRKQVADFASLELDLLRVKGREESVHVYALLGDEKLAGSEAFSAWADMHQEMINSYRAMDFVSSERMIEECKRLSVDGQLTDFYTLYLLRINELKADPPDADWDGVYTATSK